MQKKVIAAMVSGLLAAPAAFADSTNVVISGLLKGGLENYKVSGGTAARYNNEQRVSDQSSRVIFTMTEDLGAGLKAWGQVDTRLSLDTGGNNAAGSNLFATGNSGIGLAGNWGKLTVGRWDLHYTEFGVIESNRAGSLQTYMQAGPLAQVNGANAMVPSRTPNLVMFDTANYGGFTGRAGYSTNAAGNEGSGVGTASDSNPGKGNALTFAGRWSSGPMSVGASWWKSDAEGSTDLGDQRSQRAWFGWNQPMGPNALKVGIGYDRSEVRFAANASTTKRNGWLIPVAYTFGNEGVYFTYAKIDKTSGGFGSSTGAVGGALLSTHDNTDASAYVIGWDHAFSKRTSGGVYLTKVTNKANASYDMFALSQNGATATNLGEDAQQLYFGLAHSF